jgi:hypothetical protein
MENFNLFDSLLSLVLHSHSILPSTMQPVYKLPLLLFTICFGRIKAIIRYLYLLSEILIRLYLTFNDLVIFNRAYLF